MTLSGVVSISQLRTDLDAQTASIQTNARGGAKDHDFTFTVTNPADTVTNPNAPVAYSRAWTQQDDQEIRVLVVRPTHNAAGKLVSATLTVDDGETQFLVDYPVTIQATTINGTADARLDLRTTTGTRLRLLKGVRYRLAISVDSAGTTLVGSTLASLQTRSCRRRA